MTATGLTKLAAFSAAVVKGGASGRKIEFWTVVEGTAPSGDKGAGSWVGEMGADGGRSGWGTWGDGGTTDTWADGLQMLAKFCSVFQKPVCAKNHKH